MAIGTLDLIKQVATLLRDKAWPTGAAEKILSAVVETPAIPEELLTTLRSPFALLNVLEAEEDEDEPNLLRQTLSLILVVQHDSELWGQGTLIGSHQLAAGSSRNRGLLEIEDQLLSAVNELNLTSTGIEIQVVGKSAAAAIMVNEQLVTTREYRLEAWIVRSTA